MQTACLTKFCDLALLRLRQFQQFQLPKLVASGQTSLRNDVYAVWGRRENGEAYSRGKLASGSSYDNVTRLIRSPVAASIFPMVQGMIKICTGSQERSGPIPGLWKTVGDTGIS